MTGTSPAPPLPEPSPPARRARGWWPRLFGDVEQSGRWLVPRRVRYLTLFGDVGLDLREADLAQQTRLTVACGDLELIVDDATEVIVRVHAVVGDTTTELPAPVTPTRRIDVLLVTAVGDVRVRRAARRTTSGAQEGEPADR